MGYDMHWRKTDPSEAAAVTAASEVFRAACDERDALPRAEGGTWRRGSADMDAHESYEGRTERYAKAQDKVMAASDEVDKARRSYFRLNIWGMGQFRDAMERAGMAFEDEPHPSFPEVEDYGATWEDVYALESPEDYPDVEWNDARLLAATKVREATQAVLDFHGKTDTPGIPLHKFGSNDGWHVLPVEAESAVRIWRKFVEESGDEKALAIIAEHVGDTALWLDWIAYLAGSVTHDGFEVH